MRLAPLRASFCRAMRSLRRASISSCVTCGGSVPFPRTQNPGVGCTYFVPFGGFRASSLVFGRPLLCGRHECQLSRHSLFWRDELQDLVRVNVPVLSELQQTLSAETIGGVRRAADAARVPLSLAHSRTAAFCPICRDLSFDLPHLTIQFCLTQYIYGRHGKNFLARTNGCL